MEQERERGWAIDFDKIVKDGIRQGISDKLKSSYSNPLDKLIENAIKVEEIQLKKLLIDSINNIVSEADFRKEIYDALRKNLAKILIQRFGGELEKQVNVLKSDPATRAKITLVIEEAVSSILVEKK